MFHFNNCVFKFNRSPEPVHSTILYSKRLVFLFSAWIFTHNSLFIYYKDMYKHISTVIFSGVMFYIFFLYLEVSYVVNVFCLSTWYFY